MGYDPSTELIITFSIYSFFVFYLQKWSSVFQGASQGFGVFLNLFMGVATLFGLGFLIYYGIKVEWAAPLMLFGISLLLKFVMVSIEAILFGRSQSSIFIIGTVGFIICPILGYRLLVIAEIIK
tara:strand:- start:87 stop:458 length:372 start_codon:yes stop_codon:yes gene_type:complete